MNTAELLSACGTDRLIEKGSEQRETEREKEREKDRQTDRDRGRQRETERQRNRERQRQRDGDGDRQTDRQRMPVDRSMNYSDRLPLSHGPCLNTDVVNSRTASCSEMWIPAKSWILITLAGVQRMRCDQEIDPFPENIERTKGRLLGVNLCSVWSGVVGRVLALMRGDHSGSVQL